MRMTSLGACVLFGPMLASAACTRPATPSACPSPNCDAAAPDAASSSYRRACASCHGLDGRGSGPAATALRTRPPDLTLLAVRNGGVFPRDAVAATITGERNVLAHGSREMPVWNVRFGPSSAATSVAAIVAQRRIDAIVAELEAMQRPVGR